MSKVVNFMDAWLVANKTFFDFIPSSKGYPAYRDPAAEKPVGVLSANAGEAETRHWRNHYAPNDPAI